GVLGGCGVPTGGAPDPVPAADLPSALAAPAPSAATTASPSATAGQPAVFLVGTGDLLVPRGRSVDGDVGQQVDDLLQALADGPTAVEREQGLSTALPAQVLLGVRDLSDGVATVALSGGTDTATGLQNRRAVAQIVLTVTSLPAVDGVLLTQDGAAVEAPLPTGELTTRALTAQDYAGYLTGPP
ncbi:GerMN domain-containing protein, partial [Klenkia sp. PcliD-1-E]|uniref:GerMN domain-containing protein n=1 Tax=Klenkia sp. PcliD-1-E TaxID=2954492 RepID=UPI0020985DFD